MAAALAVLVAAGCTAGDGAAAPQGWQEFQAGGLVGAHPPDWSVRPEGERGWPDAEVELIGPREGGALPPVLVVFVEEQSVGDVAIRAQLLRETLLGGLPNAQITSEENVEVPGADQARLLDLSYDEEGPDGGTVPSRQVEMLLATGDGRAWSLFVGAPTDRFEAVGADQMLRTLRVE